jgi:hypothetical protein
MNLMATLIPSENSRKRRRGDGTRFCTRRDHEAALHANHSQDDETNSQQDKDTIRIHEHVLQVDEVGGAGPRKAYQDLFSKLDLIGHRLRVLVEQSLSSRNASEEATERRGLEMEIENLKASLGRLEQKAGVRYRFKSKEDIIALVEENSGHPNVCPAADCKRSYKRKDRLHEHIRKEREDKEGSREHKFLYDLIYKPFCFQCRKTFSQRQFIVHVRDGHGDRSTSQLELFQEVLPSLTQDYDPEVDNADKHGQISVVDVVSTRAEESGPLSSSRCLETAPDACSVQPQEEQYTFDPSWINTDFTMPQEQLTFDPPRIDTDFTTPQEQHAFDPSEISFDFTIPQEQHASGPSEISFNFAMPQERQTFDPSWTNSDFTIRKEHHTFVPVWADLRSSVEASSPQHIGGKSIKSYQPHAAAPSDEFTDANLQGHAEADHDVNRLSGPRYGSNELQYAIRDSPSPLDLSWTPYGDQATTQGLEDNQQPSNLVLSQIGQTQTILSHPNVTQELAAAKADEAKWQEVLCTRQRIENLKRLVQTGKRIPSPIAQRDSVYFDRQPQKWTGYPYQQVVLV